ncbi:MAG: hypothetical protein WCQ21_36340, partial [Verrucomicrobiota bacterium]
MKCLHSPRATIRSSRRLSPEVLDDASKDSVLQMLHGENDLFWHGRIKRIFADVGIATRRIEQEEAHPVWQAWLTRERFDLSADKKTAIRQLRKVLRDGGIKVVRDEFNI